MSNAKNEMLISSGLGNEMLAEDAKSKLNKAIAEKLAIKLMNLDKKEDMPYLEKARLIIRFIRTVEGNMIARKARGQ